MGVLISSNYLIAAGDNQSVTANPEGGPGAVFAYAFTFSPAASHPTFTLLGTLQVSSSAFYEVDAISDGNAAAGVSIGAGATLSVSNSSGAAVAYANLGMFPAGSAPASSISNQGQVTVSGTSRAIGFQLWAGTSFTNSGTLSVSASSNAPTGYTMGVYGADVAVYNSGSISVSASSDFAQRTVGVMLGSTNGSSVLVNSGTITATGSFTSNGLAPAGVKVFGGAAGPVAIYNSGTITATAAIAGNDSSGGVIHLVNSGQIFGDITLGSSAFSYLGRPSVYDGGQIQNTGAIHGDVHLDSFGIDTYDGRSGTLTGILYLGQGTSTVFLGNDGETVHSADYNFGSVFAKATVTGGTGSDHLVGGAGTDIFDGGAGDDSLDGGTYIAPADPHQTPAYGQNTVSYASASGGVTVSLALQGGAQNTVSAGNDTLTNFQNLTGSAFADTLTGDGQANIITGGAGNDLLTGGAGADTFVFARSGGSDTVTDYQLHSDRIDLTAFHNLHTLAQVMAGAAQAGSDTVLTFGSTAITLQNVAKSALADQDFLLSKAIAHDVTGDGYADVLFRESGSGQWGYAAFNGAGGYNWLPMGGSTASYGLVGNGDFNSDGNNDLLFRESATGNWGYAAMNGAGGYTWLPMGGSTASYGEVAVGDVNGDGTSDIIFREAGTGNWGFAEMHGGSYVWHPMGASTQSYSLAGTADFNGDGTSDILFRENSTGNWGYAAMNPVGGYTWLYMGGSTASYSVAGTGDFNGDGISDVLLRDNATGNWGYAEMRGPAYYWMPMGGSTASYSVVATGDYNGDGFTDIAFREAATGAWGYAAMHGSGWDWLPLGGSTASYGAF